VLGLIADDLTGAGDASVQFAKRGWRTFLTLVRLKPDTTVVLPPDLVGSGCGRTVIAHTTDCRALGNHEAEKRTADALTALIDLGIDRVFLKIDSTMRGSVPGQVGGAVAAWRTRYPDARAIVCPAYPRMGRTVESNRLLVNGEPVERTSFGRDPVTPVVTSDMAQLLPALPDVSVVDAATDTDLMAIAASVSADGPSVVPVGSGGLAEALAEVWAARAESAGFVGLLDRRSLGEGGRPDHGFLKKRKNPRILLQVSSLNPVSHAQVARLEAQFPDVVVLAAPAERGDPAVVAANLARTFVERFEREQWDIVGLIGGDGARATLNELGASGIRIVDSLLEGVPVGVVSGGRADGTPVFTKAGGFGAEDALVRCAERIRRES
jgi:uncharacterized protein YgbK (DUF1537 family)